MTEPSRNTVTRVVVAFDEGSPTDQALQTAACLAADLQAELRGLFVEDTNLLRAVGLPFVREVRSNSGIVCPIDVPSVRRDLAHKADRLRRSMASTAEHSQISWSFTVTEGRITQRALTDATDTDVVILGPRRAVPPLQPEHSGPVVVFFDGTTAADRLLLATASLARHLAARVTVVLHANRTCDSQQVAFQAVQHLIHDGIQSTILVTPVSSISSLLRTTTSQAASMLVIDRHARLLENVSLDSVIDSLSCSLALL